jgi:hypothetical protein
MTNRVVVIAVLLRIPEVHNLVTICAEQNIELLFHFVSAMIGGYANFHLLTSDSGVARLGHEPSGGCTRWAKRNHGIFVDDQNFRVRCIHRCPH